MRLLIAIIKIFGALSDLGSINNSLCATNLLIIQIKTRKNVIKIFSLDKGMEQG